MMHIISKVYVRDSVTTAKHTRHHLIFPYRIRIMFSRFAFIVDAIIIIDESSTRQQLLMGQSYVFCICAD